MAHFAAQKAQWAALAQRLAVDTGKPLEEVTLMQGGSGCLTAKDLLQLHICLRQIHRAGVCAQPV